MYVEKSLMYFKNYISDIKNVNKVCHKKIYDNCKLQNETCRIYLEEINSDAILLCQDSIKIGKIISIGCGFTKKQKGLLYGLKEEKEKYEIVLENYEKMLSTLQGKTTIEEAICLANLIKINYLFLGYDNYKNYLKWGERCEIIAKKLKIDQKAEWYQEFKNLYSELKRTNKIIDQNIIKEKIKAKYRDKFEEIDEKFNKKESGLDFIKFILEKYPYPQYEKDKNNNEQDFSKESQELIKFLVSKYHPDEYELNDNDENKQLNFCIVEYIEAMLNVLFTNIQ